MTKMKNTTLLIFISMFLISFSTMVYSNDNESLQPQVQQTTVAAYFANKERSGELMRIASNHTQFGLASRPTPAPEYCTDGGPCTTDFQCGLEGTILLGRCLSNNTCICF